MTDRIARQRHKRLNNQPQSLVGYIHKKKNSLKKGIGRTVAPTCDQIEDRRAGPRYDRAKVDEDDRRGQPIQRPIALRGRRLAVAAARRRVLRDEHNARVREDEAEERRQGDADGADGVERRGSVGATHVAQATQYTSSIRHQRAEGSETLSVPTDSFSTLPSSETSSVSGVFSMSGGLMFISGEN